MTTWVAVSASGVTWTDDAMGYVFADYVLDDYVLGTEESPAPDGTWSVVANSSTTWVVQ